MPTTLFAARRRRFNEAEERFITDQARLMAYLNERTPPLDWHRTDTLVGETWLEALHNGGLDDDTDDPESGLPVWLAAAARRVIRRRTHPVPLGDVRWELLTQILGHSDTWPAPWHQVLIDDGQAALLRRAAADMTPATPAPVVPLPSAMPRRPTAVAA